MCLARGLAHNPPRRPRRDLARRRRCPITESLSACGRTDRDARPASEATAGHARPSKELLVAGGPGGSALIITAAPSRLLVRYPLLENEEHGPTRALGRSTAACMATLCTSSASPARARARASESVCAGVHHGGLRAAVAKSRSEPPPSELLWRRRRGGGDSEANPLRAFPSARAHARFAEVRPRFADWRRSRAKCPCGWKEPRPVGRVTRRAAVGSAPRPRPRNRRRRAGGAASCGSGEGRRSSALPPARAPTWEVRKSTERSAEGGRRRFRCSCHHQRSLSMRKGMG